MGFFIVEEVKFDNIGVSLSNCYVSIRAAYTFAKSSFIIPFGTPTSNYYINAKYFIYSDKNSSLSPLQENNIRIGVDEIPENPVLTIYNYIKTNHFAGKTFTDDL